jgi:hypothetical protein
MANNSFDSVKAFRSAEAEALSQFTDLDTVQGTAARMYPVKEAFRTWAMTEIERGSPGNQMEIATAYFVSMVLYETAFNRGKRLGLKLELAASVLLERVKSDLDALIKAEDDIPVFGHSIIAGERK